MGRPVCRRRIIQGGAAIAALAGGRARTAAAAAKPVRIGILTELSGVNTSGTGPGSVLAGQMAAADFTAAHPDVPVEVISADHQASVDTALSIVRNWLDTRGVDAIVNVNNSAAALAVADLVRQRDKVALFTAAATSALTGAACGPNHVQWTYDTWALGNAVGGAMTRAGGDTSWLGNNAANCWSMNIGPSASRKRRQGLPRRKTACATAAVDVGTGADGAGRSDIVGLQKDGACSTHRENPPCAKPLPTSPAASLQRECSVRNAAVLPRDPGTVEG